ncbi:thiamine pyrophosphate-requiring protein [Conexibacter sp. SYSU D00693]|uniref:thiamine pyrophosphate-requiring protein n=1 Tax=Conexibacter sp. SYSU D00693 TaxID=2812560 RepID=UPI00196AA35F|nr:thiamine pyrophosphate-requiring protein [Conexibacter sp. SYSU D00693]
MATPTVGEFVLQRLREHGITRIFGYPGDGSTGLDLALEHVEGIDFVQTRHEELAALAACAHAKLTGEVGCCLATSGPGAIHLLNGLYDAKLDHVPVLALVGQQDRMSMGGDFQQEVDLLTLFKDVASDFVQQCTVPEAAAHLVDRAVRTAQARRSVTALVFPGDVQDEPHRDPPRAHGAVVSSSRPASGSVFRADDAAIAEAAEVLNAGERVAILVGQGAKGALDEVLEVAELLGAGIAKALNGRAVVPDDLPQVTGPVGLLGSSASDALMEGCDTLLLVGTAFPYAEWLPEPGQARSVQVDRDAKLIGMRHATEVNLVGDAAQTLRALVPHLRRKADRGWRSAVEREVARWWAQLEARAHVPADPVNPQLAFHELSARLPDEAIVLTDSGSATAWWARHLRLRRGMDAALSGTLATMGCAVPYALAAKLAHPDRPVVATLGDGAMQMIGINGLIDLAAYADRFGEGGLVVLVLNNGDLNFVTWEQRVMGGAPRVAQTQDLPPFDYAQFARNVGLEGIRVERPEDVGAAWDRALAAGRPAVIDLVCDPEVPPMPPEIRSEFAKGLLGAVRGGDPGTGRFVRQAVREKVADWRAGR